MLWRFGRVGVRVKSVEVVRVRETVEVIGRASIVRRRARVRLEVSIVGVGASMCAVGECACGQEGRAECTLNSSAVTA